jgi:hypothetical protein
VRDGTGPGGQPEPTDVAGLVRDAAAGEEGDLRWSALLRVLTAAARGSAIAPEREQAAVIAFRAAQDVRVRRGRRRRARTSRALAGGLAAVFALGGVTVAVGAGVLPVRGGPFHAGPQSAGTTGTAQVPSRAAPRAALPPAPGRDAPGTTGGATVAAPAVTRTPSPRPRAGTPRDRQQPAVRGLCRAYLAVVLQGGRPAAQLTARLRREAGGTQGVAAYCRALLTQAQGDARTAAK